MEDNFGEGPRDRGARLIENNWKLRNCELERLVDVVREMGKDVVEG